MEPEPLPECDCRKALYATKKDAETVRNERLNGVFVPRGGRLIRHRRSRPKALRLYECPDGAGWHLSSQEKRRNKPDVA